MRKVLDTKEGLQCENVCAQWFHCDCMNISKSDCNNLAKDTRKKWHCTRVNCVAPKPNPMAELTSSVNSLLKPMLYKIKKIELIAEVKNGIENIKTELSTILEQISNLEPRVRPTKNEEEYPNLEVT